MRCFSSDIVGSGYTVLEFSERALAGGAIMPLSLILSLVYFSPSLHSACCKIPLETYYFIDCNYNLAWSLLGHLTPLKIMMLVTA